MANSAKRRWDVVVIGAGMAGATIGYALAKAGKKVLFCEKGRSYLGNPAARTGQYAELTFAQRAIPEPTHRAELVSAGRSWRFLHDLSGGHRRDFVPFTGEGAGGSSALYGAALERLFPADFTPQANFSGDHGADLPAAWPISFAALEPYYRAAESLYRVRGSADPLKAGQGLGYDRAGSALLPDSRELMAFFEARGLHPYQLPLACEQLPGCTGCQGYLCARGCKNDSARVCLATALAEHGAELWQDCLVERLDAGPGEVGFAQCLVAGERIDVEADLFILAAGALASPALLLNSRSAAWPRGLANQSGLVGRYLMRHYVDLYAIGTSGPAHGHGLKQIAINDFYQADGHKWGTVQSFGALPPAPMIVDSLIDDVKAEVSALLGAGVALARPLLTPVLAAIFGHSTIMASIMEDLPYRENRIFLGEGSSDVQDLCIDYTIRPYEAQRIKAFRKRLKVLFKPYRYLLIKQAENNHRIAHVCGTCRFGDDPASSVLDRDNRAHGLRNLHVVDASFFPSSGGTNPALTLAANALRVADRICGVNVHE